MMLLKRIFIAITFLISVLFSVNSLAANDDASLYDAKAPAGSAFIRVFNAVSTQNVEIQLDNKKLGNLAALKALKYSFTNPGNHIVSVNGDNITVSLEKDTPYTLVYFNKDKYQLIKDQLFKSQKKAQLSFYNLVDTQSVDVSTANGKVKVFENVQSGSVVHRKINAVKVDLAVFNSGKKSSTAGPHLLRRGEISSLFYINGALKPVAIWQ